MLRKIFEPKEDEMSNLGYNVMKFIT